MEFINRLSSGEDVSRRSLARVLSPEQLANLDANWLNEKSTRNQKLSVMVFSLASCAATYHGARQDVGTGVEKLGGWIKPDEKK